MIPASLFFVANFHFTLILLETILGVEKFSSERFGDFKLYVPNQITSFVPVFFVSLKKNCEILFEVLVVKIFICFFLRLLIVFLHLRNYFLMIPKYVKRQIS